MLIYQCNACDAQAPAQPTRPDSKRILPEGWVGLDMQTHICRECIEYLLREKPRKKATVEST
jgi:hypothetical protein